MGAFDANVRYMCACIDLEMEWMDIYDNAMRPSRARSDGSSRHHSMNIPRSKPGDILSLRTTTIGDSLFEKRQSDFQMMSAVATTIPDDDR